MAVPELRTERLLLRGWAPADRAPFAALNADPKVMRWVGEGAPLTRAASDELLDRIEAHWADQGFGLWALEGRGGALVGFAGLAVPWFLPAVLPAVEIGWRLARPAWGRGLATEAGAAALAHAFGPLALSEVIATIAPGNARSARVAEKLGLQLAGTRRHPAGRTVEVWRAQSPSGNFAGN